MAARRRGLVVVAMVAGVCASPGAAFAQDAGEPAAETSRELGQRLRRTEAPSDEVQTARLPGEDTTIERAGSAVVGERPVAAPPDPQEPAPPRRLTLAQARKALGDLDLDRRLTELRRCRGEVALAQRVRVDEVLARKVVVRLTVGEPGTVEQATVSAVAPAEPALLDCVHRKVVAWRFDRPAGERVQLELPVSFARPSVRPRVANP
jgi:hypothetical protein